MDFLSLPVVMIENIFSYLSHDEIAKNRLVCIFFNDTCMRMLNRGFMIIERHHSVALKNVKAQLPRRESERRYHPMSRHCDILTSIETRISMLNMTYSKFIDCGMCCFIPGKVIDEIKRVLKIVESATTPPRAHEVLQELRDISSMAIEHFDDKISPSFRKRLQEGAAPRVPQEPPMGPLALNHELMNVRRRSILNTKLSLYLAAEYKKFYKAMTSFKKVSARQRQTIKELIKRTKEQDLAMAELKKRIEECDIKYSELTHTNQAAGGKAIAAASEVSVASTSQPLRHFASQIKLDLSVLPIGTGKRNDGKLLPNIKPRKPLIKLPSISEDSDAPPAKQAKLDESRSNPNPSTSQNDQSDVQRTQSTMTKIRGFAREIRNLTKSAESANSRLGKRSVSLSELEGDGGSVKKFKVD